MAEQQVILPEQPPKRALHPALQANIWQKGKSGNPGGVGGKWHETMRLAREAAPEAICRLIELMHDDDTRVATIAANSVLERAFGKPKEYDPKAEEPEAEIIDPSGFTPKQREQILRVLRMLEAATGKNE
jgi:hypothetical protein